MNFSSRKIRVVQIEDTRAIDDNWKPVPGSGIIDHCGCCGRAIEVHATIEDSATKERAIVGTQCAKRAGWGPSRYQVTIYCAAAQQMMKARYFERESAAMGHARKWLAEHPAGCWTGRRKHAAPRSAQPARPVNLTPSSHPQ